MSVNEADGTATEDAGWEVEPGDESGAAVVATVGRQIRLWREAKGLSAVEFGALIGYGEDLIRKIERGARIPRPEYLDKADAALGAGGLVSAMKRDVEEVRYPKQVRDLAKLEARAVEFCLYSNFTVHGLLQTDEYSQAMLRTWRPAYEEEELDRYLSARVARRSVLAKTPAPEFSFVLEEVSLRRPIGGRMVLRRQLEHLLEVGDLPHVEIQVMPTERADHPGAAGRIAILKFGDGTSVGRMDGDFNGRPVSDLKRLRLLDLRYGIIRSKALTPAESRDFVERLLGET
ncbi:helix-turn-helix domain-containing protein [Streptomyces roseicoloratus]|uniref:Helix-turn-helix transcriptional regulator n=1 Tax=Streptomyces roseicoloratus TaxID=2508722 RepID=A0ABY9RV79_9ACTN|nr:helix-turn-helix transcriptional regulator [Streptomyces roseicoloratus]WMX45598.1 helix-turn-helix transcriptional regulator [Streptomyces roseicoloratus]